MFKFQVKRVSATPAYTVSEAQLVVVHNVDSGRARGLKKKDYDTVNAPENGDKKEG